MANRIRKLLKDTTPSFNSSGLPISLIQFMGSFYRREHINLHSFMLDIDLIKCGIRTTDMHAIYRGINWKIKFLFIPEISRKRIGTKFFQVFLNYVLTFQRKACKKSESFFLDQISNIRTQFFDIYLYFGYFQYPSSTGGHALHRSFPGVIDHMSGSVLLIHQLPAMCLRLPEFSYQEGAGYAKYML